MNAIEQIKLNRANNKLALEMAVKSREELYTELLRTNSEQIKQEFTDAIVDYLSRNTNEGDFLVVSPYELKDRYCNTLPLKLYYKLRREAYDTCDNRQLRVIEPFRVFIEDTIVPHLVENGLSVTKHGDLNPDYWVKVE